MDRVTNFEGIFRWLQPRLVGYLAREVSHDVAADLAGDALYSIWRKRADAGRYAGDPQLAGLAFRIADGLLRNFKRAERRRGRLVGRIRGTAQRGDFAADVADGVGASAHAHELFRSVSSSDQQLIAYLLAGLRSDEIAAVLDVTPGTARMRLSRLRSRISGSLVEQGEGDGHGE